MVHSDAQGAFTVADQGVRLGQSLPSPVTGSNPISALVAPVGFGRGEITK